MDPGDGPVLAFNPVNGEPAVIHGNNWFLERKNGLWHPAEKVVSGYFHDLTFHPSGVPFVSCVSSGAIRFGYRTLTGWEIETVNQFSGLRGWPSVAVSRQGNLLSAITMGRQI